MRKKIEEPILNKPVSELKATEEFKKICKKYGYRSLADILKLEKPYDLLQHEGFGMRMLAEFSRILMKNGLTHYLN